MQIETTATAIPTKLKYIDGRRTVSTQPGMGPFDAIAQVFSARREKILQFATEPSNRMQTAVKLAKEEIDQIRKRMGLEPKDVEVLFFRTPEDFQKACSVTDEITKTDYSDVAGYADHFLPAMIADYPDKPESFTRRVLFHELVHEAFAPDIIKYNDKTEGKIIYEVARSGFLTSNPLDRSKKKQDFADYMAGQKKRPTVGADKRDLINELAPCYLADKFAHKLLELPEFQSEEDQREIEELDTDYSMSWKTQVMGMPFGDSIFEAVAIQIVNDLDKKCGGNGSIVDLLLKASANPRNINELRKTIDAGVGKGFFSLLRRARREDGIHILRILEGWAKIEDVREAELF
jgi:hypothetical protein